MENKRQIINIVNFIRGYNSEPQPEGETYRTVLEKIKLIDKYNFKSTFLIQYDALTFPEYQKLMPSLDKERYEIGVWFEIHKPLAEDCGIEWRGRREWDGHVHCGFSMGYSQEERAKLLDKLFEKFHEVMGYFPRVFGSWFFDTFTVRYIQEKYGLDALCNCKEQYGTDGYTLWGGYYGQAYYPSLKNVFIPAQHKEEQLNVPLFRMLGSDQVYQYDYGTKSDFSPRAAQAVITLEPVYHDAGGGLNKWVDWYMKENFNGECLSFGYAQAGQENSFGWRKMKDGLRYQFELFSKLEKENKIEIEQLGESGRWFKNTYSSTPASTITAHSAFDDPDKDSVWYCSKNYRINLYGENHHLRIRDLHIFDESMEDPFEHTVCKKNYAIYETLPAVDGFIYSGHGIKAGMYFTDLKSGNELEYSNMKFTEKSENAAEVEFIGSNGNIKFTLNENEVEISAEHDFIIENKIGRKEGLQSKFGKEGTHGTFFPAVCKQTENELELSYRGKKYKIILSAGIFMSEKKISSENGKIKAEFILIK